MDTTQAIMRGMASRGNRVKVFDWDKAAKLIQERMLHCCSAGLSSDLEWTAGEILKEGKPVMDGGCYLASTWATPVLVYREDGSDEEDGEEMEISCWKYQDETPGWDAGTVWPESALAILKGDGSHG